jgi:signal transduction histidine kinase
MAEVPAVSFRLLFEALKAATLVLLAVLLFSLGSVTHPTSIGAYLSFAAIMALQVFEMFGSVLSERTKRLVQHTAVLRFSIFLQLILASVLVAVTDGSGSIYELVYLLPIISAATKLPGSDVLFVVIGSITAMIGFIVTGEQLIPFMAHVKEFQDAIAAIVYFAMTGLLVYFFSKGERAQRQQYQMLASVLSARNEELKATQAQLQERLAQVTRMEERLQEISQMAALGEMAGQIAHEIRNPLGIIKGAVEMLAARTDDPSTRRYVSVLLEETSRLNKAVESVLRLGTPVKLKRTRLNLNELLESVVQVSAAWSLPDNVSVRLLASSPAVLLEGDYDLLHQALANLVRNACQSMPWGGTATIEQRPPGHDGMVEIAVSDRGVGIADDDLKKLGNPFFTRRQGGVGLGFSLARRVVLEHGGALDVKSRLGEGTVVTVRLPVTFDRAAEPCVLSSSRGNA